LPPTPARWGPRRCMRPRWPGSRRRSPAGGARGAPSWWSSTPTPTPPPPMAGTGGTWRCPGVSARAELRAARAAHDARPKDRR
jgi:hypothetical protein